MDKKFLIILAVIVVGLFGLFFFTRDNKPTNSQSSNTNNKSAVSQHSKGGNATNVELFVYGDFQCPVYAQYYPIENAVINKFQNDIKFTFRHFPLDTIHPNARAAHRSAEAAGLQGKFFEMYDLLYQNHDQWASSKDPKSLFESYAKQLGLDINKFNNDFASEQVNNTINADIAEGTSKKVEGTPTFFLNGIKIDNSQIKTVEDFTKVIQTEIDKNTKQN